MRSMIVCKSIHKGNTKLIANTIARVIDCCVREPEEIDPKKLENHDLVGFASGIYLGDFHESIIDLINETEVKNSYAFQISTSGLRPLPFFNNYEKKMRKRLMNSGYNYLGSFTCRGHDEYGPLEYIGGMYRNRPNEKDIRRARIFAKDMLRLFKESK